MFKQPQGVVSFPLGIYRYFCIFSRCTQDIHINIYHVFLLLIGLLLLGVSTKNSEGWRKNYSSPSTVDGLEAFQGLFEQRPVRRKSTAIREQECILGLGSERMPAGLKACE